MNFDFSEDQLDIMKEITSFAQNELNDDMIARDKGAEFSRENWKKCADYGVLGLPFSEQYGGSEADIVTTTLAMEGLGYGTRDAGLLFSLNAQMWSRKKSTCRDSLMATLSVVTQCRNQVQDQMPSASQPLQGKRVTRMCSMVRKHGSPTRRSLICLWCLPTLTSLVVVSWVLPHSWLIAKHLD